MAMAVPFAAVAGTNHTRGVILGTTTTSLDIGLPNQDDVHFDMVERPDVLIAEPSDARALVPGALVGVVMAGSGLHVHAVSVVVIPKALHVFEPGRTAWDRPAGAHLTVGFVTRRGATRSGTKLLLTYGRAGRVDVVIDDSIPVATLRGGSRAALLSPQHCFVFSQTESDGISDAIQRIIVGDGSLVVPL